MRSVNVCVCAGRVMRSVNVCVCRESDAVNKYEYVRGNVMWSVNVCVCDWEGDLYAVSKCLCVCV